MKRLAFLVLCLALTAGCNRSDSSNAVVTFDGGCLTIEDLYAHRSRMLQDPKLNTDPDRITPEFVYEHAVNMEMIITKALKEKLHQDPRIRAEIHEFMANLFLRIMQDSMVPEIDRDSVPEEEVRAYFEAHMESYIPPALYGVRFIENPDEDVIKTARESILAGEESFETAALTYSTDNATREAGGYAGKRPITKYRRDWRAALENLDLDVLSEPVRIKDKYYLFQVVEKQEFEAPDFEEKKAYVRNDLLYSKYREAWQKVYDRLKKEYGVKVNETQLKRFMEGLS